MPLRLIRTLFILSKTAEFSLNRMIFLQSCEQQILQHNLTNKTEKLI